MNKVRFCERMYFPSEQKKMKCKIDFPDSNQVEII